MKKADMYLNRLLELAFHLDNAEVRHLWPSKSTILLYSTAIRVDVPDALILELPPLFDEFDYDGNGWVKPTTSTLPLMEFIRQFFGLDSTELMHIFCINLQSCHKYDGKVLTRDCFPQHVSDNIFAMLERLGLFKPYGK